MITVGSEVKVVKGGSGLVGKRGIVVKVEPSCKWVRVAFKVGNDGFTERMPIAHLKPDEDE